MYMMACIITWLAIAILRYYLLTNQENDVIDLPKLRKIALTCTWATNTVIVSMRIIFLVLINYNIDIFPVNGIFILFCLMLFSGLFFVVSYRTDRMLKEKLENLNNSRKRNIEKDDDTDTLKSIFEQPAVSNRTVQVQQADSKIISVEGIDDPDLKNKADNNSPDYMSRSQIDFRKPEIDINPNSSFEFRCIANDYGGVYIGDDGWEMSLPNQICTNAAIHESRVNPSSSVNDEENQMFSESIIENRCSNLRTGKTGESRMDQTISRNIEEDSDRIEVVDESLKNNSKESQNSKYCHDFLEEGLNGDECGSMIQILYRDSKEHKSIIKTVILNVICLCFIMTCYIVVLLLSSYYENIYVVTIFNDFIKFQRTFGTLIASIYCFKVVNDLFKATMVNMKDMLMEWYTRIREMLSNNYV